jgi:hypothetical protein
VAAAEAVSGRWRHDDFSPRTVLTRPLVETKRAEKAHSRTCVAEEPQIDGAHSLCPVRLFLEFNRQARGQVFEFFGSDQAL